MKHDWTTAEAWGKTGAVLLASSALYVAFCVFCVAGLPVGTDVSMATGILVGFPVWIGSMCYAVLARSTMHAWLVLLAATLLLGGGAVLVGFFL